MRIPYYSHDYFEITFELRFPTNNLVNLVQLWELVSFIVPRYLISDRVSLCEVS